MKSLIVCLGLLLSINLFHEKTQACNAYDGHGGYGFFGEPGMGMGMGMGRPHMHMNVHFGGPQGYGGYNNGLGGFMSSMFRSDIGGAGAGSHHQHNNQHGRSSLIPISRHRHIHRVHRRSAPAHVLPIIYNPNLDLRRPSFGVNLDGPWGHDYLLTVCIHTWIISDLAILLILMGTILMTVLA